MRQQAKMNLAPVAYRIFIDLDNGARYVYEAVGKRERVEAEAVEQLQRELVGEGIDKITVTEISDEELPSLSWMLAELLKRQDGWYGVHMAACMAQECEHGQDPDRFMRVILLEAYSNCLRNRLQGPGPRLVMAEQR